MYLANLELVATIKSSNFRCSFCTTLPVASMIRIVSSLRCLIIDIKCSGTASERTSVRNWEVLVYSVIYMLADDCNFPPSHDSVNNNISVCITLCIVLKNKRYYPCYKHREPHS